MAGKAHLETHIRLNNIRQNDLGPLNLEIYRGEFIAVMGAAEATGGQILRMIAGLVQPHSGELLIAEAQAAGPPRAEVGFVFHEPALLASRTALGNVLLQVELLGRAPAEYEQRARELLALIGSSGQVDIRPAELTPAAAARIAVCRALLHSPALLLLDDPFARLTSRDREQLAVDLQRVSREGRITTILSTSSVQEAVLLADRVAVMSADWKNTRFHEIDLPRPRRLDRMTAARIAEHCATVRMVLEAMGGMN